MSANNVTYTLALTPENAEKIDQINRIMLGGSYTAEVPSKETKSSKAVKEAIKPTKEEPVEESDAVSAADFKKAAQQAKKDHGEDFCMEVLKEQGVEVATTLGRSIGKVDEDDRQTIIDLWVAGPTEQASDEPEEDDFGDDLDEGDDEAEVTADAVKAALKAYAKDVGRDEARELMQAAGAKSLSAVDDLSPAKLAGLLKKLV